jgi:hypothetical protein
MRLLAILALAACGGGQTPIENVTVSALRMPCQGFEVDMCLQMQSDFQTPELLFFGIEGFTHRWGVETEMTIRREVVDPALPDGPSERVIMLDLINELQPVTGPFELDFPSSSGRQWFVSRPPNLDMVGTTVLCEASVCSAITSAQSSFINFTVTMQLTGDPQTLEAISVP